jgi:hypothetical protein
VPGIEKLWEKDEPTDLAANKMANKATNHSTRTRVRRRYDALANRCNRHHLGGEPAV